MGEDLKGSSAIANKWLTRQTGTLTLYRRVQLVRCVACVAHIHADRDADDAAADDQTADADQYDPRQVDAEDGVDVAVRAGAERSDRLVRSVRTVADTVAHEILVYAEVGHLAPEVCAV